MKITEFSNQTGYQLLRIKKETIHKRQDNKLASISSCMSMTNNIIVCLNSNSPQTWTEVLNSNSPQAKGCALHTILKAEQSAWEQRGGRERTRRTGDGGRRAGADRDNCRSGRSTEKGEQGLMCRSCRCGRAGAGAGGRNSKLEQRSGKRGWSAAAAAKSTRLRLHFSSPSLSLSLRESAHTRG